MLQQLYRQREAMLPSAETLHDRAAFHWQDIEVEPGNIQQLPHFMSWVADAKEALDRNKIITDHSKKMVGVRFWDDVLTADGIDRGVTTYMPTDEHRSDYPFSLLMDTAWFTGLEGHNHAIAEKFMVELGVSVMVVGPEFTAAHPEKINAESKLAKLALMSGSFSQMRSMESSAEIYATLRQLRSFYGLSDKVIGVGESRGAMGEQIRRRYLQQLGIETIHSDITDPCVHKRALTSKKDVLDLLRWPAREVLGSLAVGVALAREGNLYNHIDTVPMTKRFHVGAVLGTGPALLSGEEGLFPAFTPLDHPQHITNFGSNTMAHTDLRRDGYQHHTATTIVELGGCHLGLAYPSVQRRVIDRTHRVGDALTNGAAPDWRDIHGGKSATTSLSEHQAA